MLAFFLTIFFLILSVWLHFENTDENILNWLYHFPYQNHAWFEPLKKSFWPFSWNWPFLITTLFAIVRIGNKNAFISTFIQWKSIDKKEVKYLTVEIFSRLTTRTNIFTCIWSHTEFKMTHKTFIFFKFWNWWMNK